MYFKATDYYDAQWHFYPFILRVSVLLLCVRNLSLLVQINIWRTGLFVVFRHLRLTVCFRTRLAHRRVGNYSQTRGGSHRHPNLRRCLQTSQFLKTDATKSDINNIRANREKNRNATRNSQHLQLKWKLMTSRIELLNLVKRKRVVGLMPELNKRKWNWEISLINCVCLLIALKAAVIPHFSSYSCQWEVSISFLVWRSLCVMPDLVEDTGSE